MTKLKKILTLIIAIGIFNISDIQAQVKQITLGVDGFTCSLCAKGVEGQLRSLDFVSSVSANLREASFELSFADSKVINLTQLRSAVTNGGFTLRSISLVATGYVNQTDGGFTLTTGNSPVFNLSNINKDLSTGDRVEVTGTFNLSANTLNVSSIKKL